MSGFIVGVLSWVLVFVCGAKMLHMPGLELWGAFFIILCGAGLGCALAVRRLG